MAVKIGSPGPSLWNRLFGTQGEAIAPVLDMSRMGLGYDVGAGGYQGLAHTANYTAAVDISVSVSVELAPRPGGEQLPNGRLEALRLKFALVGATVDVQFLYTPLGGAPVRILQIKNIPVGSDLYISPVGVWDYATSVQLFAPCSLPNFPLAAGDSLAVRFTGGAATETVDVAWVCSTNAGQVPQ
jgi:hypothetical protein